MEMKAGNSKGKGIHPGSLVMLMASPNPSTGRVFTAVKKAPATKLIEKEKTNDAWILDKPIHTWKTAQKAWTLDYTGAVPTRYLIPLNDPDAEPEQENTVKEKDKNLCEFI